MVLPSEVEDLMVVENQDYATLLTCTPYGVNTHRMLVRGHRIPYEPQEKEKEMIAKPSMFDERMLIVPIAILTIVVLLILMRRRKKKR